MPRICKLATSQKTITGQGSLDKWPASICRECGALYEDDGIKKWCSKECSKKAHGRSNRHDARRAKALQKLRRSDDEPYETVGKLELLTAFQHSCAKCAGPLALQNVWIGHILGVEHGAQHTRANIAPVHPSCEQEWNAEQRLRELT